MDTNFCRLSTNETAFRLPSLAKQDTKLAMYSMTGFGRASGNVAGLEVAVEASSVNRRNLEVQSGLPKDWQSLERTFSNLARGLLHRGNVSISVHWQRPPEAAGLDWDDDTLAPLMARMRESAEKHWVKFEPDALFFLQLIQALGNSFHLPPAEAVAPGLEALVQHALEELREMRQREGQSLCADLGQRIEKLDSLVRTIREASTDATAHYREALFQRLQKAGLELDLNDERVLRELALFADRSDVTEELTRLESHFAQFREMLKATEPVGRKLDFLCQEIQRELNTVGSKTPLLEVTRHIIEGKNELERIREQVQNVE